METLHQEEEEWRCATRELGGQCVMIAGTTLMLEWSAGSSASLDTVTDMNVYASSCAI